MFQHFRQAVLLMKTRLSSRTYPGKSRALLCLGFVAVFASAAFAGDAAPAFEQFRQVARPAAEQLGEKIVYQFDAETRVLKIGREIEINKIRVMTQVQSVKLECLEAEGGMDGVAGMPEPWVKIRCVNNERRVRVVTSQSVEGKELEELQKVEELRFLIVPCHRKSLKQLLNAYAEFRRAAG